MELKDVILSTLQELEQTKEEFIEHSLKNIQEPTLTQDSSLSQPRQNEEMFLENTKERLHVLFEGFQSPNNTNIEAKVDLTLNFLEYLLSTIETRLKEIK